jgi:ectoine hydroxylase-related dioxygenase (phytanoyl-CoA dioxygenase family)
MDAFTPADERPIVVSGAEREARALTEAHFRLAALLLHTRGWVILRDAIPAPLAAAAEAEFDRIRRDCFASKDGDGWYQVARETQAVFWERNHRWRIFPKLRPPLSDAWIVANPFALQLLRFSLGEDLYCKFVSSDTCLRGAERQAPHRELGAGDSWEPRALVVNVPMGRCGLDNGPLEVWYSAGHLWRNEVLASVGFDDDVQDGDNAQAEALAALLPSRRLTLEPGDVLVRDPGLLHRGTVNETDSPRTMLTLAFFRTGEDHSYGDVRFSLDEALYARLEPEVQALFASAFAP